MNAQEARKLSIEAQNDLKRIHQEVLSRTKKEIVKQATDGAFCAEVNLSNMDIEGLGTKVTRGSAASELGRHLRSKKFNCTIIHSIVQINW
jgi:hypothetical protein